MLDTKKYMEQVIGEVFDDLDDKSLIHRYRELGDELVLGHIFVKNYPMLKNISNKFIYLTEHECASICLSEIEKVCIDYETDRNVKLSTLLYSYVYNKMRAENNMKTYQKRRINNDHTITENIDDLVELNKEPGNFDYYEMELNSFLDSVDLTKNERKYCLIVSSENDGITDTDIAHQLGITPQAVYYIKNKLKKKFNNIGGILIA